MPFLAAVEATIYFEGQCSSAVLSTNKVPLCFTLLSSFLSYPLHSKSFTLSVANAEEGALRSSSSSGEESHTADDTSTSGVDWRRFQF